MMLAIDTSGACCVAALKRADGAVFSVIEQAKIAGSHNEYLSLFVEELLRKAGADLRETTRLVFGEGPGSFTGLRIGLAYLKALSYSLRVPIEKVCTLRARAEEFLGSGAPVASAAPAARGKCYAALFDPGGGTLVAPAIFETLDLPARLRAFGKVEEFKWAGEQGAVVDGLPALSESREHGGSLLRLAPGSPREFSISALSAENPHYASPVNARTIEERRGGVRG